MELRRSCEWGLQVQERGRPVGLRQIVFFAEFLATAGVFDRWVQDCPLHYSSPNASRPRDVLGTLMLDILAVIKRYVARSIAIVVQAIVKDPSGEAVEPGGVGLVRPELPTASVGSSQAPTAAEDSAPSPTRRQPTDESGKAVQANGATSVAPLVS